jgi:DNA repair protein RAD16
MTRSFRDSQIEKFKSNSDCHVFLASLRATCNGLNLTEASEIIFLDLWWNPMVEQQAIGRAYRLGQKLPVNVSKLVIQDTIEVNILKMQQKKINLVENVIEGGSKPRELSVADILSIFGCLQ